MGEIGFHDLAGQPLAPSLASLLEPILAAGERAVVLVGSPERLEMLDGALWTYAPASFLPHGSAADGFAERQPVWLTTREENPNGASVLICLEDAVPEDLTGFSRYVLLFDRTDPGAREQARQRWRIYRDGGASLSYWERGSDGWHRS